MIQRPPRCTRTYTLYPSTTLVRSDTRSSAYVTLDDLRQIVQDGVDFIVYDAKTKEDLTRSVLTQIIVEEEGKGQSLMPENLLRTIITCYGDNMRWMLTQYLDSKSSGFQQNRGAVGGTEEGRGGKEGGKAGSSGGAQEQ